LETRTDLGQITSSGTGFLLISLFLRKYKNKLPGIVALALIREIRLRGGRTHDLPVLRKIDGAQCSRARRAFRMKGNERPSFSRSLTSGIQQVRASVPALPNAKGNFVPIEGF